jgi:streptomycin 6-kinase
VTFDPQLSAAFVRRITGAFGAAGAQWLGELPATLARAAERWSLTLEPPYPNLSYNYAAPATLRDGTAVVLKAGVPREELETEAAALALFAGRGCARLFDAEPGLGLLLLERLQPGTMLSTLADDEAATRLGAAVARTMWQPAPANARFPTVATWSEALTRLRARFGGGAGPLPERLVALAEGLFHDLLASAEPPWLLHGDLHHFNILEARTHPGGWAVIDPKGVIGERAYDLGAFLYNPLPDFPALPDMKQRLEQRVAVLAECLAFDRQRLAAWGLAQAVLSACWSVEEGAGAGLLTLRVAESLIPLAG